MKSHRFEDVEIYVDGVRLVPARAEGGPGVLGPWEGGWIRCAGVIVAAVVRDSGWETRLASGPETGALGRRLADKALWAEGFRWTEGPP